MSKHPPAVILVRPQLAENIGMSARAMANFGLTDLRLVAPREGWPKKGAREAASGAVHILDGLKLFEALAPAVADLHRVYATTGRPRDQGKPVLSAEGLIHDLAPLADSNLATGILFGPERTGLDNDDISLADALVTFPVSPLFPSLNLAQSVLLCGYEWWKNLSGDRPFVTGTPPAPPATRESVLALFDQLEHELDTIEFWFPPDRRPPAVRNLRNIFHKAALTEQDVRTLRGVISALASGRRGKRAREEA